MFSQEYIDRRLDGYAAKIYTNLYCSNDSLILIGWGAIFQPTVPGKINITRFLKDGTYIGETIFTINDDIDYLPWLQGSSKRLNNDIYISGSGGLGAVNQEAFMSKYDLSTDSLEWIKKIIPDSASFNSILVESIILPNDHIKGIMIESISGANNTYIRLLEWDEVGNLIEEKIIDEDGYKYTARSILLNSNNETIIGVDVSPENGPISLQLWRLDSDGNILDKYISGEEDNGQKCNKIIETADGGYIFLDRVLEIAEGLPHFSSRITKLSNSLEKEWERKVGNIEFRTELYNIKPTKDGNYIAVGISVEENENGIAPAHMVKIDDDGELLWESFIDVDITEDNGPQAISVNYLYDVIELEEGGFIACGQSLGQFVDSFPQQALLIRVDDKGQLNHIFFTPPPNLEPLVVFPNPVQSTLYFKEEKEDNISYEIISLQGSLISKGIYRKGTGIDVSFLVKGMYIVRLENGRKASFVVGI